MVAVMNLSLAGLLWLGLASRGLALGIDEATDDLTLVERSDAEEVFTRDFDDELYEREFDEDLDERDIDDFELPLQVRGGASINYKERVITGPKNTVNKQPKQFSAAEMKAHEERTKNHISGPAPYRRGLNARGGASISFKEKVITGPKNTVNKQPKQFSAAEMKAHEERTKNHISGPAPYRRGLKARGGASINYKERVITGPKNTVNKQPKQFSAAEMKAHEERTKNHISGPAPYRRGLKARGGASINYKERVITGPKNTVNKQPKQFSAAEMKAHEERTKNHISGPAPYR
ncbi:unnamed protein product [Clonostachys byssicola]|uniref:Uncharacterized protein n=1 Tax=Clonostachys byssicola TaxID=160290 RepID=A0A9N9UK07_9HYPO|nr:unnamed protein product [Clonostachys byssicola]